MQPTRVMPGSEIMSWISGSAAHGFRRRPRRLWRKACAAPMPSGVLPNWRTWCDPIGRVNRRHIGAARIAMGGEQLAVSLRARLDSQWNEATFF